MEGPPLPLAADGSREALIKCNYSRAGTLRIVNPTRRRDLKVP